MPTFPATGLRLLRSLIEANVIPTLFGPPIPSVSRSTRSRKDQFEDTVAQIAFADETTPKLFIPRKGSLQDRLIRLLKKLGANDIESHFERAARSQQELFAQLARKRALGEAGKWKPPGVPEGLIFELITELRREGASALKSARLAETIKMLFAADYGEKLVELLSVISVPEPKRPSLPALHKRENPVLQFVAEKWTNGDSPLWMMPGRAGAHLVSAATNNSDFTREAFNQMRRQKKLHALPERSWRLLFKVPESSPDRATVKEFESVMRMRFEAFKRGGCRQMK